jgi:hypothetical protein
MHNSTVIDDSGDLSNPDRCTRRLYETAGRVALGLADKLLRDLDPETLIAAAMLRPLEEREAAALLRTLTSSPPPDGALCRSCGHSEDDHRGDLPECKLCACGHGTHLNDFQLKAAARRARRVTMDAATAALERAGEALKPSVTGQHKCGGTWTEKDGRATCNKCSSSWLVPKRVRPQSPWVPDSKPEREQPAPKRSIETLMREVFLEGTAAPAPSRPALIAAVLDLLLRLREHARTGHGFVTLRLSEVLP